MTMASHDVVVDVDDVDIGVDVVVGIVVVAGVADDIDDVELEKISQDSDVHLNLKGAIYYYGGDHKWKYHDEKRDAKDEMVMIVNHHWYQ